MLTKKILICSLIVGFCASLAHAKSAPPEKKAEHGKKEEHGAKEGHGKAESGHTKTPDEVQKEARASMAITDDYVHSWLAFPAISGRAIFSEEKLTFAPQKGIALVAVFIASWCLPCQKMIQKIQALHKHYQPINAQFVFVFAHDTPEDAVGFAKEYGIASDAIIADHKILADFHNPKLPSIYMSDRRTWLYRRFIDVDDKGLEALNQTLSIMTSY